MADATQEQKIEVEKPNEAKPEPEPAPRRKRSFGRWVREHPISFLVMVIVLVGIGIGSYLLVQYLGSYESTDDAQIDGDIYAVTSRVAGQLKAVYVQDNQTVKAGQLLAELDPRDYDVSVAEARATFHQSETEVRAEQPNVPIANVATETTVSTAGADVASARADVAAAEAQIAAAQRDFESTVAQIRQAEADNVKSQADLVRYRQLVEKDEVSREQYDQKDAAAKAASATVDVRKASAEAAARNVDLARAKLAQSEARLNQAETRGQEAQRNRPLQLAMRRAQVESKKATAARDRTSVDQAMLNLSYTKIVAPIDGIVGKKNAQPGQQVAPGQQMMAIVPLKDLWVTANFKETQLRQMHGNQRVTIHVDAYNRDYEGYLENFAGASGARFSLLPPENATGNYVKVVQRVPVRIRFKEGQDPNHLLRPGMSVDPKVWLNTN